MELYSPNITRSNSSYENRRYRRGKSTVLHAHLLFSFHQSYSEPFCKKIRYKHAVSRSHFIKLVEHVKEYQQAQQQANGSKDMTITAIKVNRQRGTPTPMANAST